MALIFRLTVAVLLAIGAVSIDVAFAQNYPTKPIRLIVGAGPDVLARIIGQNLASVLGQPVLVDQRPGAGGIIAADNVAKAAPDGYTLLLSTSAYTIHATTQGSKLPYNLERDLTPVVLLTLLPFIVVVNPSVPVKSLPELVQLARAKPGQLNCANAGMDTSSFFGCEFLKTNAKVDIASVPFKSSAAAQISVVSGETQIQWITIQSLRSHLKAGKLRVLAATGQKRSAQLPDVPTVAEVGYPGIDFFTWNGVHAPAGTPKEIVAKLNTEIVRLMKLPVVNESMLKLSMEPADNTPEEFAAFVKADIARWAKVVQQIGKRAE